MDGRCMWHPRSSVTLRNITPIFRATTRVGGDRRELDPLPRVIVLPGIGVAGFGRTAAEAAISADVAEAWIDAIFDAESIGRYQSISEAQHFRSGILVARTGEVREVP